MRVSLINLEAQHAELFPELRTAFERVTRSAHFIGGPEVEGLEAELAARTGAHYAVGCGSGTDALILTLLGAGVRPGDQVIVPALSFYATAGAVALIGATPVFADIEPATLGLDPRSVAKRAAECNRLRAIVPVHLYGGPLPLEALSEIAADHRAALIEDAAQALGARHAGGGGVGSGSSAGACFSFYPTKNLGALGEAGCVCCDDLERVEQLRRLRNHGSDGPYRHREVGWNARLDALQAAFLRVKLAHFDSWNECRRANARDYDEQLGALGAAPAGTRPADSAFPVVLPFAPPAPAQHAFHHYVIRVPADRRNALRVALDEAGIDTAVYYPRGLHREESFAHLLPGKGSNHRHGANDSLAETEQACLEVLALPVHPSLQGSDRDRVIAAIHSFFLR